MAKKKGSAPPPKRKSPEFRGTADVPLTFSNYVGISSTPFEIIIFFFQVAATLSAELGTIEEASKATEAAAVATCVSKIVVTPVQAFQLQGLLALAMEKWKTEADKLSSQQSSGKNQPTGS
jgi:hypothetical protein